MTVNSQTGTGQDRERHDAPRRAFKQRGGDDDSLAWKGKERRIFKNVEYCESLQKPRGRGSGEGEESLSAEERRKASDLTC